MKRKTVFLLVVVAILMIIFFAAKPLLEQKNVLLSNQIQTTKQKKKKTVKHYPPATWGYPFEKMNEKQIKFKSGQKYGQTDVLRRPQSHSYFHDGYDFGWGAVGHSTVLAIHEGTVHKVAFKPGMDWYIWVISKDGYVEIYQEGFINRSDIYVKKGQHIKLGQKIGKLTGTHVHLGVTKTDKKYIDKDGAPCKNWYKNNGTWLNPMNIITADLKRAGKYCQDTK